jgi:hypothetical protein
MLNKSSQFESLYSMFHFTGYVALCNCPRVYMRRINVHSLRVGLMGVKWFLFRLAHFSWDKKHALIQDG